MRRKGERARTRLVKERRTRKQLLLDLQGSLPIKVGGSGKTSEGDWRAPRWGCMPWAVGRTQVDKPCLEDRNGTEPQWCLQSKKRQRGESVGQGGARGGGAGAKRWPLATTLPGQPAPRRLGVGSPAHLLSPQRGRRGAWVQSQWARQPRHPPAGVPDADRQPLPAPQVCASAQRRPGGRGPGTPHSCCCLRSGPFPGLCQSHQHRAHRLRRGVTAGQGWPVGVISRGRQAALWPEKGAGSLFAVGDKLGLLRPLPAPGHL